MADTVVKMPQLGESISEGTIGRWLKQPGERIQRDEALVEIQTDKVNAEVPSPVAGVLRRILLPEGATAAVKADLAIIGDDAPATDAAPEVPLPEPTETAHEQPGTGRPTFSYGASAAGGVVGHRDADEPPPTSIPPATDADGARRFYTPVVLRMAQEHAIDLSTIQGSGAHGRVTRKDVERAIGGAPAPPAVVSAPAAPPPSPVPGAREVTLSPMRRAIAEHMTRARAEIPDAWSLVEIDMTRLSRYRDTLQAEWQAREGYELTYLPFFVKAVLAGLRAVPELNATWAGDHLTLHTRYDLGIAVSIQEGLVVPVLRAVDGLSVAGAARALRSIVQKARAGRLNLDDLQGATFTVNNPGSLGSVMSQPIVPVGQAGIVTM
ncbi:MAG TPA: dihydrolipoamide acetyltransferase family protein, partial [Chloroflexota bacterium]